MKNTLGATASRSGFSLFRCRSIPSLRFGTSLRLAATIPCALLLLILASCKEKSALQTSFAIPDGALTPEEAAIAANNAVTGKNTAGIDYDLSSMNANMVYSQVFDMMIEPEIYADKVIKMRGNFAVYDNELTGSKTYAVVIADATACCQQGIEFQYDFTEKLPQEGSEITVTGKYMTALVNDIAYNYVKAESVEM